MVEPVAAAAQGALNYTSVWMLLAAALVGFAAGWLVFEVRRAWSPESLHTELEPAPNSRETEAIVQLMPKLVEHVGHLRREIAEVRAAELEQSTRPRATDVDVPVDIDIDVLQHP